MAFRFLIALLATWRVTHLLVREDGPWDSIARLRDLAGETAWGRLMDCFKCLSLWVAAPFALFAARNRAEMLVTWLGLSAGAIIVERFMGLLVTIDEGEETDGVLRSAESSEARRERGGDLESAQGTD